MMAVSVVHKSLHIRKLANRSRLHAATCLPPEVFQVTFVGLGAHALAACGSLLASQCCKGPHSSVCRPAGRAADQGRGRLRLWPAVLGAVHGTGRRPCLAVQCGSQPPLQLTPAPSPSG
jgi:hypothetical protein